MLSVDVLPLSLEQKNYPTYLEDNTMHLSGSRDWPGLRITFLVMHQLKCIWVVIFKGSKHGVLLAL